MLLIDTDIGDDIDDAFALCWALASPTVDVVGITTTFGDTHLRARLVSCLLNELNRNDVPIGAGPATASSAIFTQATWARDRNVETQDGIAMALALLARHPGEITLVALGPLSNLRAMIETDIAAFRLVRRVVMMGGSLRIGYRDVGLGMTPPPQPEYNAARDVAGLRALLGSGVPVTMMPLDATQAIPTASALKDIFRCRPALAELTALWTRHGRPKRETPTLYDVIAMAAVLTPDLCSLHPLRIDVLPSGFTVERDGESNADVCLAADHSAIIERMIDDLSIDHYRQ